MAIQRDDVRRIAELARLEIPEDRIDRVAAELSAVLDFAGTLKKLDLEGCDPSTFASPATPLREDALDPRRLGAEKALEEAPDGEHGFFLVPPVVENLNP